jgi:hypothetical protein
MGAAVLVTVEGIGPAQDAVATPGAQAADLIVPGVGRRQRG